jgi:hypothetical protein
VPEEEEPVLDPIVEEALQPAEPIVPEPEEEEATEKKVELGIQEEEQKENLSTVECT